MHESNWTVTSVVALLGLLAFVIGAILMLSVITKKDCEVEADRANTVRAQLLLLTALVVAVYTLVSQRWELSHAVKSLMA